MQSDARTNVGSRLVSVRVLRHDASGRAELIDIEGERRLTVKGWDFKIIVGRALGWNLLKSSRFEISRSGPNFVFRGSGFGHGLGLCQEGAHVMASRGANYRQIIGKYFPGTHITNEMETVSWNETPRVSNSKMRATRVKAAAESVIQTRLFADLLWSNTDHLAIRSLTTNSPVVPATGRRTLSSEDFRINYPASIDQREIIALMKLLQSSRAALSTRVIVSGMTVRFPALEVFINETTGDFVGRTGQPPWAAAATKANRVELQPLETLRRRRILETTLRHELVHTFIDVVGHGRTPRWLAEGLALHLAGEGRMVARFEPRRRITTEEIDRQLVSAKTADEMKVAYAAAYSEVKRIINNEGEANVWRRVAN